MSLQISNELLHFFKTGENSLTELLTSFYKDCHKFCVFLSGTETDKVCYLRHPSISELLILLKKYISCFEYLNANDVYTLKTLNETFQVIRDPDNNPNIKIFKSNLVDFSSIEKDHSKKIYQLISLLTCEECERLDEAINSFEHYCYYSSVIMAVSAVEARLHHLVKTQNVSVYKSYFKNATLGQLVKLLDSDEYKDKKFKSIKNKLPHQYKPLIELLNIYRVFSAHPMAKKIGFKTAQSVLSLSFDFLLSNEAKIKNKKLLHHKG